MRSIKCIPLITTGCSVFRTALQITTILVVLKSTKCHSQNCQHIPPPPHEIIHNVPLPTDHHRIAKRSVNGQQLRIHVVYDESISALEFDKQILVKDELIPSAVNLWEKTLQVRYPKGPITLLRQCSSKRIRYKDGDPYPYCVDGCKLHTMCGETEVPATHLKACRHAPAGGEFMIEGYSGPGVDETDFILYVSAHDKLRCSLGSTVAFSAYCQLESQYNRPVAGYMNLCPREISVHSYNIHQMESTINHEILHALGFSAGLYAFFRAENGDPLTPRSPASGKPPFNTETGLYQWSDLVVRTVVRPDWAVRGGAINKTVHLMVTPKVQEEVRRHYGCDSLEGAELENQGMPGTALTHWEKRLFENEVMTGTYTQNPLVSRITLALMEDTGWYHADYSQAEDFTWGRDLGCEFTNTSCKHWMDLHRDSSFNIHPFCERVKRKGEFHTECTDDRNAVAQCNLINHNYTLPEEYQYFDELEGVPDVDLAMYGGIVDLADYCPYIQEVTWRSKGRFVRSSRCSMPGNNADPQNNILLESYGENSKCFNHDSVWTLAQCNRLHKVERFGSGCYEYTCHNDSGLHISVHGEQYRCHHESQTIKIAVVNSKWLYEGVIICPSCSEICQEADFICPDETDPPQHQSAIPLMPCQSAGLQAGILLIFICSVMSRS